jgi:hypothetical protein
MIERCKNYIPEILRGGASGCFASSSIIFYLNNYKDACEFMALASAILAISTIKNYFSRRKFFKEIETAYN